MDYNIKYIHRCDVTQVNLQIMLPLSFIMSPPSPLQNRLEWLALVLISITLTCSIDGTKANHMAYAPQYVSTH